MRYPLPYAFARTHQLLLEEDADRHTLWVHEHSAPAAIGEVLRKYPACQLQTYAGDALIQRISAAYAQGESSAAAVVSEVESDADLSRMMQELPAIEDLLETSDDAPIIRMLNALLTQAARDGASDIHIEPYERQRRSQRNLKRLWWSWLQPRPASPKPHLSSCAPASPCRKRLWPWRTGRPTIKSKKW